MPTYEFRCPEGHDFEKFYRTISGAESQSACPECGKLGERRMSATGFAFKGSGFYLTDYGKNAHRTSGSENKSPSASTGESSSTGDSSSAGGEKKSTDAPASGGSSSAAPSSAPSESKPAAAPSKPSASE